MLDFPDARAARAEAAYLDLFGSMMQKVYMVQIQVLLEKLQNASPQHTLILISRL